MGKGNVCRANQSRQRALEKAAAAGKATTKEDRMKQAKMLNAVQCTICFQNFPVTVREPELRQHLENKHEKTTKTFQEVYPGFSGQ